ncbi:head-tail connector protein [Oceanobacillus neutriphilus]|nr:head-tail connector protein [Oceanobacillus neutriphilus]
MMNELLKLAKEHLRIDGEQDDTSLALFIDSAKEYLTGAGVEEQESQLYKLGILMLVTHWYENRTGVSDDLPQKLTLGLQSIILQLKSW